MAIEFFTGFEGQTNPRIFFDQVVDGMYSKFVLSQDQGFNNSVCLGLGASYGTYANRFGSIGRTVTETLTKTVGFHIKNLPSHTRYPTTNTTSCCLFSFKLTNGSLVRFVNTASGINCYLNTTFLCSTTEEVDSNLHHLEFQLVSHASTGSLKIKKDGGVILNEINLNTGGDNIHSFHFGTFTDYDYTPNGNYWYIDNLYCADDFQGELYSVLLKPTSDAAVQFTPLSGTDNFAMLQSNDGDTSYVESDTVGHKDLYNYEDLDPGLIPIAITSLTNARKEGTGLRELQTIYTQDATEYNDSDPVTLSTTYPDSTTNRLILKTSSTAPDGTAWTREKINAMQWGFKVAG